jgi:hypothetical protein
MIGQKRLRQKSRDIQDALTKHESMLDHKRNMFIDKEISRIPRDKSVEYLDLKKRQNSRSQVIHSTIEKAKQIEENRINKILKKGEDREKRVVNKYKERRMTDTTNHREHYRKAVKLQNDVIGQQRRDNHLKKLLDKQEKYSLTQSRLHDELHKKHDNMNNTRINKSNYMQRFLDEKEQEKQVKLKKIAVEDNRIGNFL